MNNIKQPIQIFSCIAAFLILLSGCGKEMTHVDAMESYVTGIENIALPSEAKIIGLGEAPHGNVEL